MAEVFATPFVLDRVHHAGCGDGALPADAFLLGGRKRRHSSDEGEPQQQQQQGGAAGGPVHGDRFTTQGFVWGGAAKRLRSGLSPHHPASVAAATAAGPAQSQQDQHRAAAHGQQQHGGGGGAPGDPRDCPQYTARQFEAELTRVRQECSAHLAASLSQAKDVVDGFSRDLERTREENRILKRGLAIQSGRCREMESQLAAAQAQAEEATAYARRAEATNYALSVRVQQMSSGASAGGGAFLERRPPDVY